MNFFDMKLVVFCCLAALAVAAAGHETQDSDAEMLVGIPRICNPTVCFAICHRKGYLQGACHGQKCECEPHFFEFTEPSDMVEPRACHPVVCSAECYKRGRLRGECHGPKCKCLPRDLFRLADESEVLDNKSCLPHICVQHCIITVGKMGWCQNQKKCVCYP